MTEPYYSDDRVTLHHGDALTIARTLPDSLVRTIITSPPYFGLRDYGETGQLGAEETVEEYVANLVALFHELQRVLADDGTLWLNLGDSYAGRANDGPAYSANHSSLGRPGHTPGRKSTTGIVPYKNLLGLPWRVAFALQADGWILRSDIIWAKPNPMPESVTDRPSKSHEHVFLLAKQPRYYYDADAVLEPQSAETIADMGRRKILDNKGTLGGTRADLGRGRDEYVRADGMRNRRDVWTIAPKPFAGAHFAVYPEELVRPCVLAGTEIGDTVLDPFSGSGTTGKVALDHGRNYLGIDLNSDYLDLSLRERFQQAPLQIWGDA